MTTLALVATVQFLRGHLKYRTFNVDPQECLTAALQLLKTRKEMRSIDLVATDGTRWEWYPPKG